MKFKNLVDLTFDKNKGFIDETIKINIYSGKLYGKFIILSLIHIFLYYSHFLIDALNYFSRNALYHHSYYLKKKLHLI